MMKQNNDTLHSSRIEAFCQTGDRRISLAGTVLEPSAVATDFANYRDVNGVKVAIDSPPSTPFAAPRKIHLDEVEFNVPLDDSKFAMPARQAAK